MLLSSTRELLLCSSFRKEEQTKTRFVEISFTVVEPILVCNSLQNFVKHVSSVGRFKSRLKTCVQHIIASHQDRSNGRRLNAHTDAKSSPTVSSSSTDFLHSRISHESHRRARLFWALQSLKGKLSARRFKQAKITGLERSVEGLSRLQVSDALCQLKNALAMPKLIYILRTSSRTVYPLLSTSDNVLRRGLCKILNVDLNDFQRTQTCLSVQMSVCSDGRTQSEKCVHTGNFSISGFSCSHTLTPECHDAGNGTRDTKDPVFTFALSTWIFSDAKDGTNRWNRACSVVLGYTCSTKRLPDLSSKMRHAS